MHEVFKLDEHRMHVGEDWIETKSKCWEKLNILLSKSKSSNENDADSTSSDRNYVSKSN